MKVFLSHALSDQRLAERLRQLLIDVSLGLIEPWLSSSLDGLRPGDVLWDEIHDQLRKADCVITILTPNSCFRPWLLYESGYVAGNRGSQVIPLLFSINKSDLPSPLSAYVIYSADAAEDLSRLLMQLVSSVVPHPNKALIEDLALKFKNDLPSVLTIIPEKSDELNEPDHLDALGIKMLDKLKASELFHRKLLDAAIRKVTILTYTNEVEAGSMNHYRIQGKKEIHVYKRSIFADWYEQQKYNLLRIAAGASVKKWHKNRVSYQASKLLEDEFRDNLDIQVTQYFYSSPPAKRAYIFDDREAIIAYYEKIEDPCLVGGSLFKGMNKSQSLFVSAESEIGRYLINELLHYIESIKLTSHSWQQEKDILDGKARSLQESGIPCVAPKAVFLDMDGVLYDSLPHYVKAWKAGFREIGLDLPEIEVYRQEGRPGRQTVETVLRSLGTKNITDDQIHAVTNKKKEVLSDLGPAEVQQGALELVQAIAQSNLGIWVVTGSTKPDIKEQLIKDFQGLIQEQNIITGSDYSKGKPNPDPYLLAVERAGIRPEQAIVVENAPLGIESARKSGAFCLAVNTGILDNNELEQAGASVIFKDCKYLTEVWPEVVAVLNA